MTTTVGHTAASALAHCLQSAPGLLPAMKRPVRKHPAANPREAPGATRHAPRERSAAHVWRPATPARRTRGTCAMDKTPRIPARRLRRLPGKVGGAPAPTAPAAPECRAPDRTPGRRSAPRGASRRWHGHRGQAPSGRCRQTRPGRVPDTAEGVPCTSCGNPLPKTRHMLNRMVRPGPSDVLRDTSGTPGGAGRGSGASACAQTRHDPGTVTMSPPRTVPGALVTAVPTTLVLGAKLPNSAPVQTPEITVGTNGTDFPALIYPRCHRPMGDVTAGQCAGTPVATLTGRLGRVQKEKSIRGRGTSAVFRHLSSHTRGTCWRRCRLVAPTVATGRRRSLRIPDAETVHCFADARPRPSWYRRLHPLPNTLRWWSAEPTRPPPRRRCAHLADAAPRLPRLPSGPFTRLAPGFRKPSALPLRPPIPHASTDPLPCGRGVSTAGHATRMRGHLGRHGETPPRRVPCGWRRSGRGLRAHGDEGAGWCARRAPHGGSATVMWMPTTRRHECRHPLPVSPGHLSPIAPLPCSTSMKYPLPVKMNFDTA